MNKERVLMLCLVLLLVGAGGVILWHARSPVSSAPATIAKQTVPTIRITDPSRGPKDAPVTITVYSDFACESCATFDADLRALQNDPTVGSDFRVVWKDVVGHERSVPLSMQVHKAARCAATIGKFWELHDAAFAKINQLLNGENIVPQLLTELGLPESRITACIKSEGPAQALLDNQTEARALNITVTPTFFINNTRYEGAIPAIQLRGFIRSAAAAVSANIKTQ